MFKKGSHLAGCRRNEVNAAFSEFACQISRDFFVAGFPKKVIASAEDVGWSLAAKGDSSVFLIDFEGVAVANVMVVTLFDFETGRFGRGIDQRLIQLTRIFVNGP